MRRGWFIAGVLFVCAWLAGLWVHAQAWRDPSEGECSSLVRSVNGWIEFGCAPLRVIGVVVGGEDAAGSTMHMVWCLPISMLLWAGGCLVLAEIVRRAWCVWRRGRAPLRTEAHDPSRRTALRAGLSAAIGVSSGAPAALGALVGPDDLRVRRYRVALGDLPKGLDGLRVVQISDTHRGPHVASSLIRASVQSALTLDADLYVLTGDYVSASPRYIPDGAALFEPLVRDKRTSLPVLAVLGNHDWWGGPEAMSNALRGVGVRMLDNRRVFITEDRRMADEAEGDAHLCVAGVGDLIFDDVDVERAFRGVGVATPRLLLSHEPDVAELPELARPGSARVDLMLCGHTHGGQVRLPFVGAPLVPSAYGQKYLGGLVLGPRFPVIVSRGVGMSGLAVRIGVPPEIVEITLTRSASATPGALDVPAPRGRW